MNLRRGQLPKECCFSQNKYKDRRLVQMKYSERRNESEVQMNYKRRNESEVQMFHKKKE